MSSTTSSTMSSTNAKPSGSVALPAITGCEVCFGTTLEPVLDLGLHAMCDDLIPVGDGRVCEKYPIEILLCPVCLTAHQKYQVPKQALFPREYHYRAGLTADVLKGMAGLVDSIEQQFGSVAGQRVLDVGCNDGSLLSIFARRGAVTHGIDPTNAALEAMGRGHLVTQAFFDVGTANDFVTCHGQPDLITFTNVFAHIEHLPDVLAALRVLLGSHTRLVIENHYLGAVIARNQFDTFYHEHPRTYSRRSFEFIARSLGCSLDRVEFPSRYGGNIRVMMTPAAPGAAPAGREPRRDDSEAGFSEALREMAHRIAVWRGETRDLVAGLVAQHGRLRAKAFPGRAAIIVELLQLDETQVREVYEQPASPKIGHYVPGTRIPIVSDDEFDVTDASPTLNFAWHIHAEIAGYLRRRGFAGPVVPIIPVSGM